MVSDSSIRVFRFDSMNLLTAFFVIFYRKVYSDFTMFNLIFTKRMNISFWFASNGRCLDVNDRSNEA